ncbi:MAG: biotin transporter BioY [Candidatus Melainabacteria bacterium]|nr:biotin transporter BioY [Candidatus Melainabacteria bacterium]
MKYKPVYQCKWLMVLCLLVLIYLSNLVLARLPFVGIDFNPASTNKGLLIFLQSLLPHFYFDMQIYGLQTVAVWACGIILGPQTGFIAITIYLVLGFLGLPVFASGGGLDYFKEPTFGYLISFPLNAFLSGWLYEKNKKFLTVLIPLLTTHFLGIFYILLFKRDWLDVTWHISFSMIGYDLILALLLTPIIPIISFVYKEMFIQELPDHTSLFMHEESKKRRPL